MATVMDLIRHAAAELAAIEDTAPSAWRNMAVKARAKAPPAPRTSSRMQPAPAHDPYIEARVEARLREQEAELQNLAGAFGLTVDEFLQRHYGGSRAAYTFAQVMRRQENEGSEAGRRAAADQEAMGEDVIARLRRGRELLRGK